MKKLRVAFIGWAHVHLSNMSRDFAKHSEAVEIVGTADYCPFTEEEHQNRAVTPKKYDFFDGKIFEDYKELLAQGVDLAVINTDIKAHADVVEELLGMGIHVLAEKPMALDMADAKRMYRAAQRSTAELMINWPIAWFPAFRKAKALSDSGAVGKVLRVHYRSPSTRGPHAVGQYTEEEMSKFWWYSKERGGGSISDYAGYGCVLTTWFTGKVAKRVSGMKKNFFLPFSDVEDYSTFTIDFGDAIGLIEGSWSTMSNGQIPTGPIVYGTEGVIVADRFAPEVKVYRELLRYQPSPDPDEVYNTAEEPCETMAENVVRHLQEGAPLHELLQLDFNMKVMAAFDAGRRSCESGKIEEAEEFEG
ncbi:MAG: Gfo/Idh/MocA family oxidoreductase [Clostridia bacterium]|nr:Gfo/Idh/MocA family oxidoreductase [Clostridia bacterium]